MKDEISPFTHMGQHPPETNGWRPVVSSALSSVAGKWELPVFTLPFNILICLHVAATGAGHPYFPQVDIRPKVHLNDSEGAFDVLQVFGCDSPWTAGLVLMGLLLCSPAIFFHAVLGSAAGVCVGLALAAPQRELYSGLWGFNSALSCIAIGGNPALLRVPLSAVSNPEENRRYLKRASAPGKVPPGAEGPN
ncbi:unnamed protein product, partial [Menidia menidia]